MLPPAGAGSRRCLRLTQGSRTRPGLHATARWRGLASLPAAYPGLADSPGLHATARWRGLASLPAAYPGLADSPWATRCRPLARARVVVCRLLLTLLITSFRAGTCLTTRLNQSVSYVR